MEWDVFISHAWEDKESFARPLAQGLADFGLKVWFDECTLTVGDSLRRSIDQGLARSRFGIVVISRNFLQKEWPQKELDGLVAREVDGIKVILPVWHEITADEVRSYSPLLADRLAASSDKGLDHVIAELIRAIQRDSPALSATTRFIPDQTGESNGPGRAAKLNTLGTPESERAKEDGLQPTQEHVVLLIHGIRTTARWIGMIKNTLERSSTTPLIVELVYYGRFSLLRFLLPGPTRWGPVATVKQYVEAVRKRNDDLAKPFDERRRISVIAHSFGTYCLFRALDKQPNIKLHRVILCGFVLPTGFDIGRYRLQLGPDKILNECGDRDPWPVLAKKIAWGCGSAGTFGLSNERARNRFHRNGHSDYFDAGFVRDMWEPFLSRGDIKESQWDIERSEYPTPWWISALDLFPLKFTILAILAVGIFFYLEVTPSKAPPNAGTTPSRLLCRTNSDCGAFGTCIFGLCSPTATTPSGMTASSAGACPITVGGGFKVCRDNVTETACNAVARQIGGTPSFVAGGKCK
jgi:hypothetical protein